MAKTRRHLAGVPACGRGGESGVALFGIVILAGVMVVLVLSVLLFGSMDAGLAEHREAKSVAFYLAEGGLARGVSWLEAQGSAPSGTETILPFGEVPETTGEGSYLVSVVPDSMNPTLERPIFTIVSTGYCGGDERTLELLVRVQLFTDFLYFTDNEHEPGSGAPIWFHSDDVIDGPLFTNDQISIRGDPTFLERVTSAYGGFGDPNPAHNPMFLYYNDDQFNNIESTAGSNSPHDDPVFCDGYELGATYCDYPDHHILEDFEIIADGAGIELSGTYTIQFARPDETTGEPMYGYLSYRQPGAGKGWTDVEISSFNGLLYVNGSFDVLGTVDGAVTLATNGSIRIADDIVYRDSDADGPCEGCDDLLGLVAGTDITVSYNVPNLDDCVIHAAMVALDNCFRAEDWASGPLRGDLSVFGSIIQSYRGAVGTSEVIDDVEVLLTGYAKDYHYDWRLIDMSPPFFELFFDTGLYGRLRWQEVTS